MFASHSALLLSVANGGTALYPIWYVITRSFIVIVVVVIGRAVLITPTPVVFITIAPGNCNYDTNGNDSGQNCQHIEYNSGNVATQRHVVEGLGSVLLVWRVTQAVALM